MLRYSFLAGFLLLAANTIFAQGFIVWEEPVEKSVHKYRNYHVPDWARSFADTSLKKVLVEPKSPTPVVGRNLPPGVKPVDYIGRDGLPGDPLPASVMFGPREISFDKLRQMMIDEWKTQEPAVPTPRK